MDEQKSYKWFFVLAIIYGLLKLGEIFIDTLVIGVIISIILFPIALAWSILSIVLLIIFIKNKLSGYYLFLPIYYIAYITLSILIGFLIGISGTATGFGEPMGGGPWSIYSWVIYTSVFSAILEIGYALFMLSKK